MSATSRLHYGCTQCHADRTWRVNPLQCEDARGNDGSLYVTVWAFRRGHLMVRLVPRPRPTCAGPNFFLKCEVKTHPYFSCGVFVEAHGIADMISNISFLHGWFVQSYIGAPEFCSRQCPDCSIFFLRCQEPRGKQANPPSARSVLRRKAIDAASVCL